ncbi:MAG: RagB/SusD family nutrient uptake outer membrane protein [Marinifilaceae bacterium]
MRNYNILFAFILLLVTQSCDSFLDMQPKGILIPKYYEDYVKLINYPQLLKTSDSYPSFITDNVVLPDGLDISEDALMDLPTRNLYTFQTDIFGDAETDGLWDYSYNRIYYYNTIIDDIMSVEDATLKQKQALRAEALLGRAFEYLNLVNAYAKHYDSQTAATDDGIPLMLDKEIAGKKNLKRASVQQVYDRIKQDLDTAAIYLPERPEGTTFRASKPVGLGMLARMYLYMGRYELALKYAQQSLALNETVLDLTLHKVVDPDKSIGRTDYPSEAKNNPENIYVRLAPYVFGMSGSTFVSEELVELYEQNEGDMRKELFMTKKIWGTEYPNYVWCPYVYANLAMNVPEMLLIAAECEARIGSKENAMEFLNKLMVKRIKDFTNKTATSNQDALALVLAERRREMAMVGCARLIDLKRLNREPAFAKTITHVVEGKTYTLKPTSSKYILPIPNQVIAHNPEMKQNERND